MILEESSRNLNLINSILGLSTYARLPRHQICKTLHLPCFVPIATPNNSTAAPTNIARAGTSPNTK
ncbi:hypothetical protein [Microcoleus sp. AT3-D2]|uniref:hypothetical protein n=1 Tax=Microcoleus sp. AT3-D2 TaxID=2818612 RepID=UPI002FD667B1